MGKNGKQVSRFSRAIQGRYDKKQNGFVRYEISHKAGEGVPASLSEPVSQHVFAWCAVVPSSKIAGRTLLVKNYLEARPDIDVVKKS